MSLDLNVPLPRLKAPTFGTISSWGFRLVDTVSDLFRKVAFEVNDVTTHHEQVATPARAAHQVGTTTVGTACISYMKGDKYIIRFFDGTNDHFFSLDLTATTNQSWVYSLTAP